MEIEKRAFKAFSKFKGNGRPCSSVLHLTKNGMEYTDGVFILHYRYTEEIPIEQEKAIEIGNISPCLSRSGNTLGFGIEADTNNAVFYGKIPLKFTDVGFDYPRIDEILSNLSEPDTAIRFSIEKLLSILKAAKASGSDTVTFAFRRNTDETRHFDRFPQANLHAEIVQVAFEDPDFTCCLMPYFK